MQWMSRRLALPLLAGVLLLAACGNDSGDQGPMTEAEPGALADVIAVSVAGESGAYSFSATVASPDSGCDRYADWWEVLSAEGELLYRRTLLHSHVDEQPFTRSGGPVPIGEADEVIVRAHMSAGGYGGATMRGSPGDGFAPADLPPGFAAELEMAAPQPPRCAF